MESIIPHIQHLHNIKNYLVSDQQVFTYTLSDFIRLPFTSNEQFIEAMARRETTLLDQNNQQITQHVTNLNLNNHQEQQIIQSTPTVPEHKNNKFPSTLNFFHKHSK
jgi:hypothetical protein